MEQLIKQIEQWASDRNIIKGSKPIDQAMKLFSEFGELADNVGKGRDCRDDIGDVFVVLTIMSTQMSTKVEIPTEILLDDLEIKQHVIELGNFLNNFSYQCAINKEWEFSLDSSMMSLVAISEKLGYSLEECVQLAYNDIKDRKGLMHNGIFIKESDPAYASVVKSIEENYNA